MAGGKEDAMWAESGKFQDTDLSKKAKKRSLSHYKIAWKCCGILLSSLPRAETIRRKIWIISLIWEYFLKAISRSLHSPVHSSLKYENILNVNKETESLPFPIICSGELKAHGAHQTAWGNNKTKQKCHSDCIVLILTDPN